MDKKIVVKNAIEFLGRVELKGVETPAFVEVIELLNSLLKEDLNKDK